MSTSQTAAEERIIRSFLNSAYSRFGMPNNEAHEALDRLCHLLHEAAVLVPLLTVRQVIHAGDAAIDAAGLNPWCINEGLATGDEEINWP